MSSPTATTDTNVAASGNGKAGNPNAWTEAEKNELLLRLFAQVSEGSSKIDWKRIEMSTGRTIKAMQGQFTKINADIKALSTPGGQDVTGGAPTPTSTKKTATPRKRKNAKNEAEAGEAGEDDGTADSTPVKAKTPRKRAAATANGQDGSAKKKRTPKKAVSAAVVENTDDEESKAAPETEGNDAEKESNDAKKESNAEADAIMAEADTAMTEAET